MNSRRFFFILLGLVVILGGAGIAAVVYGNIALKNRTSHLVSLKAESVALESQQRQLIQAKKDIETYAELEQIVSTILPKEKNQARTVRELDSIAKLSGIRLGAITFPSSTLGQAAPRAAAPAAGTEGAAPTSTPAAAPTTQVKPVDGIAGLYQMEVNVQSAGPISYTNFLNFLKNLEKNRTTSQISNLNVLPEGNNVTFTLTITVYIKP